MNTDLDTRLVDALSDAARTTHISDDAFDAIVRRTNHAGHRGWHPWAIIGAAGAAALAVLAVVAVVADRGAGAPAVAMIRLPAINDPDGGCGNVTNRPPTADELAQVAVLPSALPAGYEAMGQPDSAVQERARSTIECWSADAAYLDPETGRVVVAMVQRQGDEVQTECRLPEGYLPVRCATVDGRPGSLTDEGSRATVSWITASGDQAYVSAYGLSDEELLGTARSLVFDGSRVSVRAPGGMVRIEQAVKTRTDDRSVTSFVANYTNGTPSDEIVVTVTTWNDLSLNIVGPARSTEVGGAAAVVVTTGGPGTGIIGWEGAGEQVRRVDQPARAYITWNRDGLTFRVDGPSAEIVTEVARALRQR